MKQFDNHGGISILVLWVGVVFSIVLGGMAVFGANEYLSTMRGYASRESLMLAEAGVQYYKWHLAHDPDDYQDGTGQPGPYVHEYHDPAAGLLGTFSLEIEPPEPGSQIVTIRSTGQSVRSSVRRTIKALYGEPSYAQYSFLNNSTMWFGSGLTIYGRVLSNGGIRQDGYNTSTVQSSRETYSCGTETGCSPPEERAAVWGSGGPSELWEFPVPSIDFNVIGIDFAQMRESAIAMGTRFSHSGAYGYRFIFADNGTVAVYRVTNAGWRRGYSNEYGCQTLYQRITHQTLVGTYNLAEKNLFFAEDTVWVEGVVNGRATIAAARFPLESYQTNIWINDNLVYLEKNGNHSLGLVAENDIYFVLDLPQIFEVNAALLAQSGKVFRHHYRLNGCSNNGNAVRDQLILYGALISNNKSAWNWGSGPSSGFTTRDIYYDSNLYLDPPPYFPTQSHYELLFWDEVDNP